MRIEAEDTGKDFAEGQGGWAVLGGEGDDGVRSDEFAHDLTASSAGRTGHAGAIGDSNGGNFGSGAALADGAKEGIAFGAAGEAVGDVFDIAARDDGAVVEEEGGADVEAGIRRVGVAGSILSRLAEAVERRGVGVWPFD